MAFLKGPLVSGVIVLPSSVKVKFNGTVEAAGGLTAVGSAALDYSALTPAAVTTGSILGTGANWIAHSTLGSCGIKMLLSYTGASGEFASLRIRARSNSAGSVAGGNFSASAGQNNHGDLYAVQGYAQPLTYTQATAANIVCALYGCVQRSAGGTSVGRDWVAWIDTHMAVKASGGSYLMRLSHNGSIANDGVFTIYNGGLMPVLFNFEDAAGFLTETGDAGSTKAGYLAVKTPAGTKYLQLVTA